jgi:hypothetical protein
LRGDPINISGSQDKRRVAEEANDAAASETFMNEGIKSAAGI